MICLQLSIADLKSVKRVKQKVLHWITNSFSANFQMPNNSNIAKQQVMTAYYPVQKRIQMIFKAVSMIGTIDI